jgi:hypothetical protein
MLADKVQRIYAEHLHRSGVVFFLDGFDEYGMKLNFARDVFML